MNIEPGIKNTKKFIVKNEHSAKNMGSGTLDVLSTPMLVTFMEDAASQSLESFLDITKTSVGTNINIDHLAASSIGTEITVETIVTKVSDKMVEFDIKAFDNNKKIGEASHKRFVVSIERFMSKLDKKL